MPAITPQEFKALAEYIRRETGIALESDKAYLIETRLGPLVTRFGCRSFSEFYFRVLSDLSGEMKTALINSITTQETLFFRDKQPFELLRNKIIPELADRQDLRENGPGPIRVLSAACSTGQEVYSIAMTFHEVLGDLRRHPVQIHGIDISDQAIARASYAHYNKLEVERGLDSERLERYFEPAEKRYRVRDFIRSMVSFQKYNLLEPIEPLGRFDVIFCRNLAIYFAQEQRVRLFEQISRILNPKGYLIIGASEYLSGICPVFFPHRHLRTVFYTFSPDPHPEHPPAAADGERKDVPVKIAAAD